MCSQRRFEPMEELGEMRTREARWFARADAMRNGFLAFERRIGYFRVCGSPAYEPTAMKPGLDGSSPPMAIVSVHVWDATGNKRQQVDMPDDAPVNRILAVLLEKMNFPQYAPDGQILSYKFHHRSSGKQLLDDQCLRDVGVKDGDVLRLQPEITAGRNAERRMQNEE